MISHIHFGYLAAPLILNFSSFLSWSLHGRG